MKFPVTGRRFGGAGVAVLVSCSALGVSASAIDDSENSPLYALSRLSAYADMSSRDRGSTLAQDSLLRTTVALGEIIVVEENGWSRLSTGGGSQTGGKRGSAPMATIDVPTCMRTCSDWPTCGGAATCNGAATCYGAPTCSPSPTCVGSGGITCAGTYTCDATCAGYATCNGGPTCSGYPTCSGSQTCSGSTCSATCGGNSTCINTCNIGNCPAPLLYSLVVSNDPADPGKRVVQFSFNAFGSVRYAVQYCTNINALQWSNVFTKLGDGTATTFVHTNRAPRAFYRVSMQDP